MNQNQQNPNNAAPQDTARPVVEEVSQASQQTPNPNTQSPPSPVDPQIPKPKNKFKKFGLLALGIVIILIIIFLVVQLFRSRGTSQGTTQAVTLTWWGHWENPAVIQPVIDAYQQENPNITINYTPQSKTQYRERLTNALAQGRGPDIMRIHNTWIPMYQSVLAPLPGSVMTPQEYADTFYTVAAKDSTITKGIVAMPLQFDGLALYLNLDITTAFASENPQTWTQVLDNSQQMSLAQGQEVQQTGIALGYTQNIDHWEEIFGLMTLQNGTTPGNLDSDLVENAVAYYRSTQDFTNWNNAQPNSTQAFASGKSAMYLGPHSRLKEILSINPDLNISIIPAPQIISDPELVKITYATYWTEAVNAGGANPTEAWKFLKFVTEKQNLQTLNQNLTEIDGFGEIPSRADLRDENLTNPQRSAFIRLAPWAQSWYLADNTGDGDTGINTQLSTVYATAIENTLADDTKAEITEVLNKYGIR